METRTNYMDINTITVILAIIAIVPTAGALILQARREARQIEIDEKKAEMEEKKAEVDINQIATNAAVAVTASLQGEVARMGIVAIANQTRIAELENALIIKTKEFGTLTLELIDKDSELRTMKYRMGEMQLKLDSVLPTEKKKKESTVPLEVKKIIADNEEKKAVVQEKTVKAIEELKNTSITNHKLNGLGE